MFHAGTALSRPVHIYLARGWAVGATHNDELEKAYHEVELRDMNAWQRKEPTVDTATAYDSAMADALAIEDPKERAYVVKDLEDQTAWQRK